MQNRTLEIGVGLFLLAGILALLLLAQTVAAKLPAAIRMGKRAFQAQRGLSLADAYTHAGEVMCENMMLPDTDEGLTAFLEKRPAAWVPPTD